MVGSGKWKNTVMLALPLAAGIVLLSSCFEVEEQVTMHADGSGVMKLSYGVARIALGLATSKGSAGIIPLPAAPGDFAAAIRKVPGLTLASFTPTENTRTVGANLTVDFSAVGKLDQVLGSTSAVNFRYSTGPNHTTFTQNIFPGTVAGVDPDTLALVEKLFSDYRLSFSLTAPKPVQTVNRGAISSHGTTATFTTTIPNLIESKKPVVWEVSW